MSLRSLLCVGLLLLLTTAVAPAQQLEVGKPAPAIVATTWLNWKGDAPTLESQKGRVIMIEFWGTWCAPCVRAMPGIQKLHDRYTDRGLTVLAISYETPEKMQEFLTKNSYTMPVGSDPEKKTISAYAIRGWPTTIVIDKEGNIAHVGTPYDAEAAVEKALGLEAGASASLNLYFDSLKNPAKSAQREALQRLVEKAPSDFDLQAWAKGHLAPDTLPAEGAPPPAAPATKAGGKPVEATELLRRCARAWSGDAAQRAQLLQQLGETGPTQYDLATFAQETFAKDFPFDAAELKSLLQEKKFATIVEAIAQRPPAAAVLGAALKHAEFSAYCKSKSSDARVMAKKGVMAQRWVFSGAVLKDEELNSKFWNEMSVNGMATSKDKKSVVGITLGGEMVMREKIESFIKDELTQALIMEELGSGKAPKTRELAKQVDSEREKIVRDLEGRYGKPETRAK